MPTYYVAGEVRSFHHNCRPIIAWNAAEAAEQYCSEIFESGDVDVHRPLECIVAEDEDGAEALKFKVRRTFKITDEVSEDGPIEVPADDEDEDP